jgi:hypothetical protein
MTFRCTAKVTRRFRLLLDAPDDLTPPNLLGDWYVNLFNYGPERWVLCLSEKTNLPVLVHARNSSFPERFPDELGSVLRAIGVPAGIAAQECARSSSFRFGKTINRSVLGSLNDMAFHIHERLTQWQDHAVAAAVLSRMPCRQKDFIFPGEAVFEHLGIAATYDKDRIRRIFGA